MWYCFSIHLSLVILERLHLDPQMNADGFVRNEVCCWKMLARMIDDHTQNEAFEKRCTWEACENSAR